MNQFATQYQTVKQPRLNLSPEISTNHIEIAFFNDAAVQLVQFKF